MAMRTVKLRLQVPREDDTVHWKGPDGFWYFSSEDRKFGEYERVREEVEEREAYEAWERLKCPSELSELYPWPELYWI